MVLPERTTSRRRRLDGAGLLETIAYPDAVGSVTRGYDDAGRWVSVTDWDARTTTFAYDRNSNWVTTVLATGTGDTDVRTYDEANQLTSITWNDDSAPLGSLTYSRTGAGGVGRDVDGLVDQVTATGAAGTGTTGYGYDGRDQLTGVGSTPLEVDPAGNLTVTEDGNLQVFDVAQQLCWTSPTATSGMCDTPTGDATTYAYDERGNRIAMRPPSGATPTSYGFDQADRMTTAHVPATDPGADGQYTAIAPSLVLDTRVPTGVCDGTTCGQLAADEEIEVQVTGRGNVPSTGVAAVYANLNIPNPATAGVVKANRDPVSGAAAATVNFVYGHNHSAVVILPVDANGRVTIWASVAAHVTLRVAGYFTDPTSSGEGLHTLAPARLADTRSGSATGICGGGTCSTPSAGATTAITAAGQAGIPATGATAAVLSVTVHPHAQTGSVQLLYPNPTQVAASILHGQNKTTNDTVIAPINSGSISLYTQRAVDVTIDVIGYVTAPTSDTGAWTALEPTRVLDTSDHTGFCLTSACDTLTADARIHPRVTGAGVPAAADAAVVWVTVIDPAADGYAQIAPSGTAGMGSSATATVDYLSGIDVDTLAIVPLNDDGTITIATSTAADVTVDVIGYVSQPLDTWTYTYDSTGLRTTKQRTGDDPTEFSWDLGSGTAMLIGHHVGDDDTWVIYGPGGPLTQIQPTGESIWFRQDHAGSTRLTTDEVGGVETSITYGAYGLPTASGAVPLMSFGGQFFDAESSLVYLRHRFMDPVTGQFTTGDPAVLYSEAPYAYASGNPVNGADPSGLFPGQSFINGAIEIASNGQFDCLDLPGADCTSIKERYPDTAQAAANAAGGVLSTAVPFGDRLLQAPHFDERVDQHSPAFMVGSAVGAAVSVYLGAGNKIASAAYFGSDLASVAVQVSACIGGKCRPAELGASILSALVGMPYVNNRAANAFGEYAGEMLEYFQYTSASLSEVFGLLAAFIERCARESAAP